MEGGNKVENSRNWFRRVLKRLRGTKDLDCFLGILPPEVIDSILKRITDHNTLLRCRLVCFQWKQVIDNLLEKHRLSKLTNWESDLDFRVTCLTPSVWTPCESKTGYNSVSVVLPSTLKKSSEVNPFPHKSVAVIGFNHCHLKEGLSCPRLKHRSKVEIVVFFQQIGHFLSSLVFHDSIFRTCDLASILCALPNLKVLTLSQIILNGDFSTMTDDITITPSLSHLKLINSCTYRFTHYILPVFSSQLVTLKIVNTLGFFPMKGGNFSNLRQLSIHNVTVEDLIELMEDVEDILQEIQLECLSVMIKPRNPQRPLVMIEQDQSKFVVKFIKHLSNPLIQLRLSLSTVSVATLINFLNENGLRFPNVRHFEYYTCSEFLLKETIQPWFPKLQGVECISICESDSKIVEVQECLLCGK